MSELSLITEYKLVDVSISLSQFGCCATVPAKKGLTLNVIHLLFFTIQLYHTNIKHTELR